MALLDWNESFSVGIAAMDKQHHLLVNMLNELHEAMLQGKAQTITGDLLQKLVDFTGYHFIAEEKILKDAGFPTLEAHHKLHEDLCKEVNVFVERYRRGEQMINLHLMNFLRNWLSRHILEEDREYGRWINRAAG